MNLEPKNQNTPAPADLNLMIVSPDGGYGWVIVGIAFFINSLAEGVLISHGTVLTDMRENLNLTNTESTTLGAVQGASFLLIGPVASALINYMGFRWSGVAGSTLCIIGFFIGAKLESFNAILLTYSFLGGTGLGIAYLSCTVLISYYFEKNRALSTGMAMSGGGFGMILVSACDQLLVSKHGWQSVSFFYGCLSVVMLISCLFMKDLKYKIAKKRPVDKNLTDSEPAEPLPMCRQDIFFHSALRLLEKNGDNSSCTSDKAQQNIKKTSQSPVLRALNKLLDLELLKSPSFLILSLAGFCFVFGFDNPLMLMKARAEKNSKEQDVLFLLIPIVGATYIIGRLVACLILHSFEQLSPTLVCGVATLISGTSTIVTGLYPDHAVLWQLLYAAIYGFHSSFYMLLQPVVLVHHLGLERLTNAFGLSFIASGLGHLLGPMISGVLVDRTDDFELVFFMSGGCLIVCGLLFFVSMVVRKIENK